MKKGWFQGWSRKIQDEAGTSCCAIGRYHAQGIWRKCQKDRDARLKGLSLAKTVLTHIYNDANDYNPLNRTKGYESMLIFANRLINGDNFFKYSNVN